MQIVSTDGDCHKEDMPPFTRFFVSQRFGAAAATVQIANARIGFVLIRTESDTPGLLMFNFAPKEFGATYSLSDTLAELILRCAIAQAHRADIKGDDLTQAHQLLPTSAPWLGDFHQHRPAGKAPELNLRTRGDPDRRKGNPSIEKLIASAIRIRQREGRDAARHALQRVRVPPSVIRRVLTNAPHRRRAEDR